MLEPRPDMLPDQSQTEPDVSEDVKPQTPKAEVKEDTPKLEATPKGSKTDETQLYAALKEERSKRRELEERIKELEASSVTSEFLDEDSLSLEGKALKQEIRSVMSDLESLKKDREEERVFNEFPWLKDKIDEFDEFRNNPDNSGMPLRTLAKAFSIENNLVETIPTRKGLEQPTGGERNLEPQGITASDVDRLMKTQPRKFIQMVREGKIKAEDIK